MFVTLGTLRVKASSLRGQILTGFFAKATMKSVDKIL